jgi:hypothetical protein
LSLAANNYACRRKLEKQYTYRGQTDLCGDPHKNFVFVQHLIGGSFLTGGFVWIEIVENCIMENFWCGDICSGCVDWLDYPVQSDPEFK